MNRNKSNLEFPILVAAMVALAFMTIVGMVVIFVAVEDTARALALAGAVNSVTVPLLAVVMVRLTAIQSRERNEETKVQITETKQQVAETKQQVAETKQQVAHVGEQINGRMNHLLQVSGEAREMEGRATGLVEGHAAGMRDERAIQDAREEKPK
jgi:hypothetical protein